MSDSPAEDMLRYHEETKHHADRYARSLGYMDWDNQPNPFRVYEGAPIVNLPLLSQDPPGGHLALYEPSRASALLTLENIAGFLELSMGLSAWKAISGSRWSLRMNPSSGNLHPTEVHLVLPDMNGCSTGIYHYSVLQHALERRAGLPGHLWRAAVKHLNCEGFLAGLTSIFWRESWKYGERAFRYCNHDVGHALACISISANLQGWKVTYLNAISDEDMGRFLGLDRTPWPEMEEEHPDLLCLVHPGPKGEVRTSLSPEIIDGFSRLRFEGLPNTLSRERLDWEIIYRTASLVTKPASGERRFDYGTRPFYRGAASTFSAAEIIRKRRSAVAYDGRSSLTKAQFFTILDRTLPRNGCAPFDAGLGESCAHFLLFVHKVEGLDAGLYFLVRDEAALREIKDISDRGFLWQPVEMGLPIYLLKEGDFRGQATLLCCEQDIAGSSSFSLGMITKFREVIEKEPYRYRHLFWETGMIGQVLYLEAEAQGARGTGIGCFFDDAVHETMGLKTDAYQSLYHFTVGKAVEDRRLATYPPYHHLGPVT